MTEKQPGSGSGFSRRRPQEVVGVLGLGQTAEFQPGSVREADTERGEASRLPRLRLDARLVGLNSATISKSSALVAARRRRGEAARQIRSRSSRTSRRGLGDCENQRSIS
ncbi:hypothetical protein [Streptomyces sp. NPDC053427]|uniref:hypothetical protein n=1 Tax=Streptomyces sp. NPDC053427 TaxID=3365701 RepID=UPI0037CD1D3A